MFPFLLWVHYNTNLILENDQDAFFKKNNRLLYCLQLILSIVILKQKICPLNEKLNCETENHCQVTDKNMSREAKQL